MYQQFFGLTTKPFSLLPDPDFLFLSKLHAMAYGMLEYGLQDDGGGFTVITGEIGTGKTTLINKLLAAVNDRITVGVINSTQLETDDMLRWVIMSYNLPFHGKSKVELYQTFTDFTNQQYHQGKYCVLIVDEAQNLDMQALEELRMLTNVNSLNQKFKLILAGQPELLSTLRDPRLQQFAQRVAIQYHLKPLNREDAFNYVQHRVQKCGGSVDLFNEDAVSLIWYHSEGVPRVMNNLCDLSLVYAFAEQQQFVDAKIVSSVIHDRMSGGLFTGNSSDNKLKTV